MCTLGLRDFYEFLSLLFINIIHMIKNKYLQL